MPERHEPGDVHRERRLEPDDAVRRVGELALLLVVVVRRVIGRDEIDRAVRHRLLQRRDVVRGAQRRVHLRVRVVALDRVFRERDVMRTDLRRHVDAALLPPANQLDRSARAHVAEVDVPAGAPREEDVADRHDLFGLGRNALETEPRADDAFVHRAALGERRLLAVVGDGNAERARVLERRAHQVRARDRLAVVAHGDRAGARPSRRTRRAIRPAGRPRSRRSDRRAPHSRAAPGG